MIAAKANRFLGILLAMALIFAPATHMAFSAITYPASAAVSGVVPEGGPYYGPHMWGDGWGMILGPLMMIVFIAAIVVVVVLVVRWLGGSGHGGVAYPPPGKMPLDILKERFARGEIDKDELEDRRRALGA